MNKMHRLQYCIIIFIAVFGCAASRDLHEVTTRLDDPRFRFLFHWFRNFVFNTIGPTGHKTEGSFLQEKFPNDRPFPCEIRLGVSKAIPTSVHKLRPGDIKVIAALGDSLTSATGAMAQRIVELSMENRGLSWSIGGQWDYRNATTLPNILKVYNPKLIGFSFADSFPFHKESQFNLAEIGAVSSDLPFMAKMLVKRMKNDPRLDFKRDWKMLTISIGGNDICSFICLMNNPESLPEKHRSSMLKTLRYLRENMPRTFVNIVSVPFVETVMLLKSKPSTCKFIHRGECTCWVGKLTNATKDSRLRWQKIQRQFIDVEEQVAMLPEFRGLNEFAVMYQPWTRHLSLNVDGKRDLSLLAFDCFHLSQKGNGWAGTALWNNLLESTNQKSQNWRSPLKKFNCPSRENPFFYTYDNS